MNTHKLKLATLALVFSFAAAVPAAAKAYFTTDQQAVRLTNDTTLFTITYKFGFSERAVYMPLVTTRETVASDGLIASFVLLDDDNTLETGTASGIILTNSQGVEIRDNKYYVPAGQSATFTLFVLATLPPETIESDPEMSLLMTHLPFTMVIDGVDSPNKLNPSELKYYRTPTVRF